MTDARTPQGSDGFTDGDDPVLQDEVASELATNDAVAGETVLASDPDDESSDGLEDARVPESVDEDPEDAPEDLPESRDEVERLGSLVDRGPQYAENDLADEEESIDLRDDEDE